MQSKTLVVEDESEVAQLLAVTMKKAGLKVGAPENGHEVLALPRNQQQRGMLILDLMVPGIDGLDLCEELDRVMGLDLGACDYVVKPLKPAELLLRVRLILGRAGREQQPRAVFRKAGLEIDFEAHRVSLGGQDVDLTAVQFKLLSELVVNRGKVLNREYLLDNVWGYQFEGYVRTVDTHISRLRQRLPACSDLIETVRGVGYRFRV
jgi:two-component system phosphate regulon response regulator PhoB